MAISLALVSPAWAQPVGGVTVSTSNNQLFEIIAHADPVVKGVMAILVIASIATWAIWFVKHGQLRAAKVALKNDVDLLSRATSLDGAATVHYPAIKEMVEMVRSELDGIGNSPSFRAIRGVEERVGVRFPIIEARAIHHMLQGTNVLASIGATAPFVGLAGTVWGIMHSFLGIAQSNSTSLAVVAPGIAEALFATALGLAAAIPAVLIYNTLSRSIAGYRRMLSEAAVMVACVLEHESERRHGRSPEIELHRNPTSDKAGSLGMEV
ncbi:tonB-system energizer ExbB [Sphingobium sp. TomMM35A]|uniref:tonB-system energizer ExbB n=1 Tax=unclassified Sphingobium TaxID=2611147 RepID=UPI00191926D1|nr:MULTISPECIES: tonB-system energizer ExbB [unclassified Sphingobium]CAD7339799.1 Tol-Pal system protein TolQ [Sphingobium sp. S8]CAD7340496.1 Tol-Pal system protein TolQ [Sphingobium sp. S6]